MSEWLKVYPSAADKIFVTVADEDSPTGFSIEEKTPAEVLELITDSSIPVVSMFYGVDGGQAWVLSSEGGCGIGDRTFADGVISIAHDFSNTNAVVKRLDDTYNYEITSDEDELLQITVTDSEDELLSALDANVKFLVNFNVAGL